MKRWAFKGKERLRVDREEGSKYVNGALAETGVVAIAKEVDKSSKHVM